MTEKQNAEMLELADRIRDIAYSGVNNFDDFSSYKLDLIQDCAKKLQASLAAPSPHPRGEPVAWQIEINGIWQNLPGDWSESENNPNHVYRPLYAAPPSAGADAVREAVIEECAALLQRWSDEAAPFPESERCVIQATVCRNAAVAIRNLTPPPQEKPTGDQT